MFTSSFVVFGLLFAIGNPPVVAYLLLLDVIWGAVFLCTKRGKNKAFLHSCVGISLASACALCAVKLAWGHSPRYPTIWEGILLGLALLVHLFALRTPETTTAESDLPKLYPRRKYDYERVKMYVTNFSMVGINAPWGTGKSFVVDQLCIFRPSESKETVGVSPPSREKQVQVHGRESTGVLFWKEMAKERFAKRSSACHLFRLESFSFAHGVISIDEDLVGTVLNPVQHSIC